MKAKKYPLSKYGLAGSHGLLALPGMFHVNAPFDACGKVFVEWEYRRKLKSGLIEKAEGWKRMTAERARKEGRKIITCSVRGCKRPAVSLDHLWPYHDERNRCKEHWEKEHGG